MRPPVTEEMLEEARRLRAAGTSWNKIARTFGRDSETIRSRIDPEYAGHRRWQHEMPLSMLRVDVYRPSEIEFKRLQRTIPKDSRSLTARACGDPLPGRSALDKRRAAEAAVRANSFAPVKAERTYYLRGFLGP